jgi:hypothetical protein
VSAISASPSSITADGSSSATITVQLKDAQGNNRTSSGGTIVLSTTLGTLGAVTDNNNGTYTATLTGTAAGTAAVSGTLGGVANALTSTASVSLVAGAASKLALNSPADITAGGTRATYTVTLQDGQGNTATAGVSGVSVTLSANGTSGVFYDALSGGNAITSVAIASGSSSGTAYFMATTAGTYTVSGVSSPLTTATDSIGVNAGSATKLAFATQASSVVAGATMSPAVTVEVQDQYGNRVTTATDLVALAFGNNAGSGTLTGGSAVNAVSGVATFSGLSVNKAATGYTLSATSGALTGATSSGFDVSAGSATTLAVNGGNNQSATVNAAVTTAPSVKVTDAQGNAVSGVSVTFAVATGGGSLAASGGVTTDSAGIATSPAWTLGTTAGANTLTATSGSLSGSPVTFTATGTAGAATQLAITTQPVGGASGAALATQPVVTVRDQYGNTLTTDNSTVVTVAILSGTGGTLGVTANGSLTSTASAGVVTFGGVTLSGTVGQNYVLRFTSSPTLTAANSGNVPPRSR